LEQKKFPDNTQLIKEYSPIEETTKANSTWMTNPNIYKAVVPLARATYYL
jgi:hypothetical protein